MQRNEPCLQDNRGRSVPFSSIGSKVSILLLMYLLAVHVLLWPAAEEAACRSQPTLMSGCLVCSEVSCVALLLQQRHDLLKCSVCTQLQAHPPPVGKCATVRISEALWQVVPHDSAEHQVVFLPVGRVSFAPNERLCLFLPLPALFISCFRN